MPAADEPRPVVAIFYAILFVVAAGALLWYGDPSRNAPETFEGIHPTYAACARIMGDLQKYSPEWGQAMKACIQAGGPPGAKPGPQPECRRGPKGNPLNLECASQQHIYAVQKADFVVRFTRLANIVFMHAEPLKVTTIEPWKPVFSITVPKCMAPYWDQFHIPVVRATCDEQGLIRICDVALGYRHPRTIELAWKRRGNGTGAVVYGGFSLTWPTYDSIQCQPCPVVNV